MGKKIFAIFVCSIALMMFVSTLNGQGSKKTLTLPNGEVVVDLNGEWDVIVENYGKLASWGSYQNIWKITQEGSSFEGFRVTDDKYHKKGSKALKGELDKGGIKYAYMIRQGATEAKCQISDDGNKIMMDDGIEHKVTLTRK
jgi:hypothetical protein